MKVSDYIVDFLVKKGIAHVFGYPGGTVTHLMESFRLRQNEIHAYVTYHEQGAAFAACGYAQVTGQPGVAYATSGPGATNLITGICNAWFDSIPTIFLTGQVNTTETRGHYPIRQRGFQEADIVSMVKGVTKYAVQISDPIQIRYCLERAWQEALSGRKGPVLLDIPMNIFRADVDPNSLPSYEKKMETATDSRILESFKQDIQDSLENSQRPSLLLGNGSRNCQELVRKVMNTLSIPCLSTMIAQDILGDSPLSFGFIGAYGHRQANFVAAKSDLIISIGARLDVRQVGARRETFAPNAKLIRVDIDPGELSYPLRSGEHSYALTAESALEALASLKCSKDYGSWRTVCQEIREALAPYTLKSIGNQVIEALGKTLENTSVITTDVGQNQVWVAQSFPLRGGQQILFSGGLGAMGYSLPAAIGACLGSGKPVGSISGDGGFQMNIQELQIIAREHLPIKIAVINNHSLGMIRHFQEMYFQKEEFQTTLSGGYSVPDFAAIASSYGIPSKTVRSLDELNETLWGNPQEPMLVEIQIDSDTYVFPKLEFGKPNQDQEPLIPRDVYARLMAL